MSNKKCLRSCINWLDRSQIKDFLESIGTAVYDHEETEDLRDALQEAVESGDFEECELRELVE